MQQDIQWHRTHCGRMDQGGCSLLVGVREGRVVKVKGDPEGYLNQGYICAKGRSLPQRLYHPDRMLYPRRRLGARGQGRWERVSWEKALEMISENLQSIKDRHGARSVAFCSGMPKGLDHFALIRLANTFGTPNMVGAQDVCHMPRELSGRLSCGFYPVPDYRHSTDLILLWGSNPLHTNEEGCICKQVLGRLQDGARLLVIDPRRTELAGRADLFLQPRPGTDAELALGMLGVILQESLFDQEFVQEWTVGFEQLQEHCRNYPLHRVQEITKVPEERIIEAARMYARAAPAVLGWGNALEQSPDNFACIRALVCLMAVCGNLDQPGGNIWGRDPQVAKLKDFVRLDLLPGKKDQALHAGQTLPGMATVPPAFFRRSITEGLPYQVRGAYMQSTNPMLSWADSNWTYQALQQLDFLAVSEIFPTPSSELADIVLPAAINPEFDDIGHFGLGHGYILARPQVVDPPGECRSDLWIVNQLGRRLTDRAHWPEQVQDLLQELLAPSGLSYSQFAAQGVLKAESGFAKYKESGFATPSGKVELSLSKASKLGVTELPTPGAKGRQDEDYPLLLSTAKSPYYLHSGHRWVQELRERHPEPLARMHPETAQEWGIQDQAWILIETPQARISQKASLDPGLLPGVVLADSGWWFPEQGSQELYLWAESNYNLLTSGSELGSEFGTPRLRGLSCRVRPA
ncbi:MAG: molybdopterin-containing oxidoreductase family protein [Desulfohalobiaceae bacterium]